MKATAKVCMLRKGWIVCLRSPSAISMAGRNGVQQAEPELSSPEDIGGEDACKGHDVDVEGIPEEDLRYY